MRHYADDAPAAERSEVSSTAANGESRRRVLYPRAGTLGGCTAHNAMIFVYPHNSDWDQLADLTGDRRGGPRRCAPTSSGWSTAATGRSSGFWRGSASNPTPPRLGRLAATREGDPARRRSATAICATPSSNRATPLRRTRRRAADRVAMASRAGAIPTTGDVIRRTPSASATAADDQEPPRVGARERLLDVAQAYPDRLTIETNALATRVLFDGTAGGRRRVSEGRPPVPRARARRRRAGETAQALRDARGDPRRAARSTRRSC